MNACDYCFIMLILIDVFDSLAIKKLGGVLKSMLASDVTIIDIKEH